MFISPLMLFMSKFRKLFRCVEMSPSFLSNMIILVLDGSAFIEACTFSLICPMRCGIVFGNDSGCNYLDGTVEDFENTIFLAG